MDPAGLTLIHRGAEADLYLGRVLGWEAIVKHRVQKRYRQSDLDRRIRRERTIRETTIISEAHKAGVRTPTVISADPDDCTISMSFVPGKLARDRLDETSPRERSGLFQDVGRQIGRLHGGGIVHGDFTTSNIIVSEDNAPFMIDFGLSIHSNESEARAVDLHLLRRSIETSHVANASRGFKSLIAGYSREIAPGEVKAVQKKVIEIGRRGRYFAIR